MNESFTLDCGARAQRSLPMGEKMNKKTLMIVAPFLLITGCQTMSRVDSTSIVCNEYEDKPAVCTGSGTNPKVTITFANNEYKFNPPNVCANAGTTIEFTLTPPPMNVLGSASILPKDDQYAWLTGTNTVNSNKIHVLVPPWVSPDPVRIYGYKFVTSTGVCIDPRVQVTN